MKKRFYIFLLLMGLALNVLSLYSLIPSARADCNPQETCLYQVDTVNCAGFGDCPYCPKSNGQCCQIEFGFCLTGSYTATIFKYCNDNCAPPLYD